MAIRYRACDGPKEGYSWPPYQIAGPALTRRCVRPPRDRLFAALRQTEIPVLPLAQAIFRRSVSHCSSRRRFPSYGLLLGH